MIARDAPRVLHASAQHGAMRLPQVRSMLEMRHEFFGDAELMVLSELLQLNTTLTLIHLKKNAIGDDGANALGRAISAGRLPIRARWLAVRSQGAKRVQCRCPRRPGRTA